MLSNTMLPVVALAGTALAACPLSVAIVEAVDHTATVAVTNTGSEAVTVFKGNTVLSDHDTLDLEVTAAGGQLSILIVEILHTWDSRISWLIWDTFSRRWHRSSL